MIFFYTIFSKKSKPYFFIILCFALGLKTIDGQSTTRAQALSDYQNNFVPANVTESVLNWTGNTESCDEGTISTTAKNRYLQKVKYFRRLVGVSDNVSFSTSLNSKCQKAALIMHANDTLEHVPLSSWNCYSADGAEAAGSGNLASYTINPIELYIEDSGPHNIAVLHRRYILNSNATQFGIGQTNLFNSMWTFQSNPSANIYNNFIAYPPNGYIPNKLVYPRWSFGIPNANFDNATVTVKDQNNYALPVSIIHKEPTYAVDNTIVFEPSNIDTTSITDIEYTITISNISNAPSSTYTYKTTLFEPIDLSCSRPTASQNTTSSVSATSARLNTSISGNRYDWRYRKSSAIRWTNVPTTAAKNKTITGLTSSTAYIWQSRRRCTNNVWSAWSSRENFTTKASCSRPTASQNTTSSVGTRSARLNTSASGNRYDWRYRKDDATNWTNVPTTAAKNKTITGLTSSTAYIWQSRRRCTNNAWSTWSSRETFTTKASCSRPTASQNTTTSVGTTSARLNTSASGNRYDWRYRKDDATNWTNVPTTAANNLRITGLLSSTTYIWQSRRRCTNNVWSTWSSRETFTTGARGCSVPSSTQNTTINITPTSARLKTTNVTALEYEWKYGEGTTESYGNTIKSETNDVDISGLTPNLWHHWAVRIRCSNGWSVWSIKENFKTLHYDQDFTSSTTKSKVAVESEGLLLTDEMIKVVPNPAIDYLTISTDKIFKANLNITLFDSYGSLIRNFSKTDDSDLKLDVSNVAAGVYFLKFSDSQSVITKKIVVNR